MGDFPDQARLAHAGFPHDRHHLPLAAGGAAHRERLRRLERAIDEALAAAPPALQAPIAALQALRGIAKLSAATIVTEVGRLSRFATPRQLMGYSGAVSSEYSTGSRTRRGRITRTGNAHLRRVVVEAAWAYRPSPSALRRRDAPLPPGGPERRGQGDRLESPASPVRALPPPREPLLPLTR